MAGKVSPKLTPGIQEEDFDFVQEFAGNSDFASLPCTVIDLTFAAPKARQSEPLGEDDYVLPPAIKVKPAPQGLPIRVTEIDDTFPAPVRRVAMRAQAVQRRAMPRGYHPKIAQIKPTSCDFLNKGKI